MICDLWLMFHMVAIALKPFLLRPIARAEFLVYLMVEFL